MTEDARWEQDGRVADPAALAEAWPTPEPPSAFIEQVMIARRRRARRRLLVGGASAVALLGLTAAAVLLPGPAPLTGARAGALTATARTTVAVGQRARAVAEVGSSLRYQVEPSGRARVSQQRGDVFYRVDQLGGRAEDSPAFVVATPSAEVRVTGTCFRVEVKADETTLVSVMEGHVEVKDARGVTTLGAGETVTTAAAASGSLSGGLAADGPSAGKFTDFTPAEWAALASRCALRMQLPPYAPALRLLSDEEAALLDLGPDERASYDQELQAFAGEQMAALVRLHQVLVEGEGGADNADRSYVELDAEIRARVAPAALAAARRRYAEARAGLAPPPDPAKISALDRFIDLHASASERFEARLAARLGAVKARALRDRPGVLKLGAEGCPRP
jgi:hypothetical protein